MSDENNMAMHGDNRKLEEVFMDGWNLYEFLDETTIDTNGVEYRTKVIEAMKHLELATTIVSQIGMFSPNELIDEVSTDSLPFLLLPYFLGKLAMKRNEQDRGDALRIADIYLRDFLQRCKEYELCDGPKNDKSIEKQSGGGCLDTTQQLVASAMARNSKIEQFKRKKELEEHVRRFREAVKNHTVDDEVKRDFYLKFLQKSIIDTTDELENIKLEKGIVEMRKQRMAEFGTTRNDDMGLPADFVVPPSNALRSVNTDSPSHNQGHGHSHHHHHQHPHPNAPPKPKPLQPFVITRDATQKAIFGMGYPSLPVMTVDDFYNQRVQEGIFPDAEKMARINQEKALAALQDPEEIEEQEKAAEEVKVENDDPENIDRMRRMDEYKDVVRRGDGNRYNRS